MLNGHGRWGGTRSFARESKTTSHISQKRRKNRGDKKTRHHSVPKVVCKKNGIDPGFKGNIIPKLRREHEAWHTLFNAHTPWKVEEMLRKKEFKLRTEKMVEAYKLIFGDASFEEAADIVKTEWHGLYRDEDSIRELFKSQSSG